MNHDNAHCVNWTKDCPEDCFRGQLTKEYMKPDYPVSPVSWVNLYGTEECPLITPGERKYHVSYMVVYDDVVTAKSPVEAAEIVAASCPYDVDGSAYVTDIESNEKWEI